MVLKGVRAMKADMNQHGVNDDIMEIFEITGFDSILEIV